MGASEAGPSTTGPHEMLQVTPFPPLPSEPPPEVPSSTSTPRQPFRLGVFEAPVTTAFLGPAFSALENTRRWSEEPFPFAWFLTPLPDFIQPDSLVYLAGYEPASGTDKAFMAGGRSNPDTPQEAAHKTVALGFALCTSGLVIMTFPSFPTLLILRLGGAALVILAGFLIFFALPHSIPDFVVGLNLIFLGAILILFRGFGGFLVANMMALWLFLKGLFRACPCTSALVGGALVISSLFTSSVVGFLLGYDMLLCGLRVVATGKRMASSEPSSVP